MVVAVLVSVLGLVTVVVALFRDAPLGMPPAPQADWDLLPTPSDVSRVEFPVSFPGYDPATVETTFEALRAVYADLLAAATPEVLARARQRSALRQGLPVPAAAAEPVIGHGGVLPGPPPPQVPPADFLHADEREALRAVAALAPIESRAPDTP